jgi:pimeloyl-ACP methyl ester carboxylesterase
MDQPTQPERGHRSVNTARRCLIQVDRFRDRGRVPGVAPDLIGWGKSPKPDIHYSFQLLAANTAALLDHLGVGRAAVLGHSTGGMTAVRFTLMNPDRVPGAA